MKTALTCALLAISFLGSQCSYSEDGGEQDTGEKSTKEDLYEKYYRNDSGLCGAQYRNLSYAEPVYNCTLRALPPIVNKTWEEIRLNISKSIPDFVKLMCNFTVAMPDSFYLVYTESNGNLSPEEDEQSTSKGENSEKVSSAAVTVTTNLITKVQEECTANITGWTTEAPTNLEPTETPEPEAIP